jgi:carboxymethylenebutenolidase
MDSPCCKGVVRDASALTGESVTIGDAPAYLALPKATESKPVGVVVIHDIWGFNIPNAKYIADHFAANGFPAVLPNLYHGISTLDGWPGTESDDGEALEGIKWDAWWDEITAQSYWQPFHARVAAVVKKLKEEHGVSKVCMIGFCWGGLAIEQLSTTGGFAAAASVHGCHEGADNFKAAKAAGCGIAYHTVPGDESFPEAAQKALLEVGAPVTVYEGMEHGFAVRGDFAGDAKLKTAADTCLEAVVAQFFAVAEGA